MKYFNNLNLLILLISFNLINSYFNNNNNENNHENNKNNNENNNENNNFKEVSLKPKPKPKPNKPIINITNSEIIYDINNNNNKNNNKNNILNSISKNEMLFGDNIKIINDLYSVITSASTIRVYEINKNKNKNNNKNNNKWKELVSYSYNENDINYDSNKQSSKSFISYPSEIISSVSICDDLIGVALMKKNCDDDNLSCQLTEPKLDLLKLNNGKLTLLSTYSTSYLWNLLYPTTLNPSYTSLILTSFNIECSNTNIILTSSWKDLSSEIVNEFFYGIAIGSILSLSTSSSTSSSTTKYIFESLNLNSTIPPKSQLSLSISNINVLIATISSPSNSLSAHFYTISTPFNSINSTQSSINPFLYHKNSFSCDDTTTTTTTINTISNPLISTEIYNNMAVVGIPHQSEVYVFTLLSISSSSSSSNSNSYWKLLGILKASDSYNNINSLFGFSVSLTSKNILVGSPCILDLEGKNSGAVYIYSWNNTLTEWFEQKFLNSIENTKSSSFISSFGTKVYATDSIYLFSDIPSIVNEFINESISQNNNVINSNGKVYIYLNNNENIKHQNNNNNDGNDNNNSQTNIDNLFESFWMLTILCISIPATIILAFVGFHQRHRLFHYQSTGSNDDSTHNNCSSNNVNINTFNYPSCLEFDERIDKLETKENNKGASIIQITPLKFHSFKDIGKSKRVDVESQIESPLKDTQFKWKFNKILRMNDGYNEIPEVSSPVCKLNNKQDIINESKTEEILNYNNKLIKNEVERKQIKIDTTAPTEETIQKNWFQQLYNQFLFTTSDKIIDSSLDMNEKEVLSKINESKRSILQSPLSNPMISPAVIER